MHELGVLLQVVKSVDHIAAKNRIQNIKHITLEIGELSGYLPVFFEKLFPVAADAFPAIKGAQLRMQMVSGNRLFIKEIGY